MQDGSCRWIFGSGARTSGNTSVVEAVMFTESQVELAQKVRGQKDRRLWVKLLEPRIPAVRDDLKQHEMYKFIAGFNSHFKALTYWGYWKVGRNSITDSASPLYSLNRSGAAPKLWVFGLQAQTISFLDVGADGPTELSHPTDPGKMKEIAATLRRADDERGHHSGEGERLWLLLQGEGGCVRQRNHCVEAHQ